MDCCTAGSFSSSIVAFDPSQTSGGTSIKKTSQISNCIVMSYSKYWDLFINESIPQSTLAISFNSVHLKLDHSQLSTNTDIIYGQLSQMQSTIEIFYPNVDISNLLSLALDQVVVQLNQMRLFLVYFALPGLLIGAYLSKYAIDLTIKERQKEIKKSGTSGERAIGRSP